MINGLSELERRVIYTALLPPGVGMQTPLCEPCFSTDFLEAAESHALSTTNETVKDDRAQKADLPAEEEQLKHNEPEN